MIKNLSRQRKISYMRIKGLMETLGGPELDYAESQIRHAFPGVDPESDNETLEDWCGDAVGCMVCLTPRSGSTYLTTLLESTGRFGVAREFMNLWDYKHNVGDFLGALKVIAPRDEPVFEEGITTLSSYVRSAVQTSQDVEGIFVLKGDLYQFLPLFTRGWLHAGMRKIRFVYVTREDVLMQAISLFRAIRGGAWSSEQRGEREVVFERDGILDQFEYLLRMMKRWETLFSLLGIHPLRMTYEQISRDPAGGVRKIASFLGMKGLVDVGESALRRQRDAQSELWAAMIRADAALELRESSSHLKE
jgi:LPS sulfotransferase NodH